MRKPDDKGRPVCGYCGAKYGSRKITYEQVKFVLGKKIPRYLGNGIVLREYESNRSLSRKSVDAILAKPESEWDKISRPPYRQPDYVCDEITVTRDIWYGEWWGGYDPFCTMRCALAYARRAWQSFPLKKAVRP